VPSESEDGIDSDDVDVNVDEAADSAAVDDGIMDNNDGGDDVAIAATKAAADVFDFDAEI
jgi:hypothetical protein